MKVSNPDITHIAPIQSLTLKAGGAGILGILVAKFMAMITGTHIDPVQVNDTTSILTHVPTDWAAIMAAFSAMWMRIGKWNFDKSALRSSTFWMAMGAAVLAVLNAMGMDTAAIKDFGTLLVAIGAKYLPVALFILQTFGAWRAHAQRRNVE